MATIWKRLMTAMRAASYAFNEKALVATDNYTWDEFDSRLMRYYLYDAYYANIAYRDIATTSALLKKQRELYTNTRAIYNPVFRLVEGYVAKTYGGSLDFEDMSTGAIPLLMASEEVKAAVRQLWLWSNWRTKSGTK